MLIEAFYNALEAHKEPEPHKENPNPHKTPDEIPTREDPRPEEIPPGSVPDIKEPPRI